MTTYCFPVNVNFNPLTSEYELWKDTTFHKTIPLHYASTDLINFTKEKNLKILLIETFYTNPNIITEIHVDLKGGDYTKLNWIFGGKNSKMRWYSLKENNKKEILETPIKSSYIPYTREDISALVYEEPIHSPSIVQVGVPHNIVNYEEPRICVSVVLVDLDTNSRITMNESKLRFQN